jgi:hypothetical protein
MKTDKVVKKLGAGAKIILNVGLFPTVFGLFLWFFQTTVQFPQFFSVEFVASPNKASDWP